MNPKRSANIKTKLLPDGHVVLYSEKTDWAHVLNPRAALIWEFCDGVHSPQQILQELQAIGSPSLSDIALSDIEAAVSDFEIDGLLAAPEPPG